LRADKASMMLKPATATSTMPASEPPASITSAAPRRIISAASPMALVPEAHAVTMLMLGPRAPSRMAI